MMQTNRTAQRKRRSKVVLALGAAGLSLSLASSASAAIGGMNGAGSAPVSKQLSEEEISDVSLATFHVFDRENAGIHRGRARLAMCACGIGFYYPVDPPPRPIRPAHKYKSHSATS
jgi:hypothetical protein